MESFGFKHSPYLQEMIRTQAADERAFGKNNEANVDTLGPDGKPFAGQHVWYTMLVFVNPMVASLPQHAHLMAEKGCFSHRNDQGIIENKDCGTGEGVESTLPPDFRPLELRPDQDNAWMDRIKQHIQEGETGKASNQQK